MRAGPTLRRPRPTCLVSRRDIYDARAAHATRHLDGPDSRESGSARTGIDVSNRDRAWSSGKACEERGSWGALWQSKFYLAHRGGARKAPPSPPFAFLPPPLMVFHFLYCGGCRRVWSNLRATET